MFVPVFGLALVIFSVVFAGSAIAQAWIQVESQPDIRTTKQRAQVYGQNFNDTRAFLTDTGWYAIVIGPMSRDFALSSLSSLKASGEIPRDAFVTNGSAHRSQLWPVAAGTDTVLLEEADTPNDGSTEVALNDEVETPAFIADEDLKGTKKLERTWSRDQKKEYQTYLVWTGDYESAIDGAYGPGTRRAIRSFQEREGFEPTGYLTQSQVDMLTKGYTDTLDRLGVALVRDLDAGIEVQMPTELVEFGRFEPPFVHYKSKPGSNVRIMLISQEGNRETLTSLYDIMKTFKIVPEEGYRVKKRDWFVLSGRDDTVVSYTYAKLVKGLLKGFTLVWTPEGDRDMKPVATAMYNSFNAISDYVLDETLGYGDTEDEPVDLTTGIDTDLPDRLASGFIVNADGMVLTHISAIRSCSYLTLDNGARLSVLARSPKLELAVLAPVTVYNPESYALFSGEALEVGNDVSVAGFAYPEVMDQAALNYGVLSGTVGITGAKHLFRLDADLEDGDAGGPVLDDRGAVIGMQRLQLTGDNPFPSYVNVATKAKRIMALLDRHNVVYGKSTAFDPVNPVDLSHMATGFTVKVACWN